jgi:O-antigen ligase
LVPKYPWGEEVLGAGQAGCAASLLAILLVGMLIYSKSAKLYKSILCFGILFLLTFVVLTGARSIALMTMVALGIVLTRWLWRVGGANFRKYFVGACLTFIIVAIAMSAANPRLRPKGTSFAIKFRAMIWCNGLKMISRAPIFGYGPIDLGPVFRAGPGLDLNGPQNILLVPNEAHNDPITWTMRFGLPGYVLYLLTLGSLLSYLWTTSSKLKGTVQGLTEGAAAAIVGAFTGSFFTGFYFDSESGTFFFLVLGIVIAAGLEASARISRSEHNSQDLKVTHILFADEDATKKIELVKSLAKMPLTQKILAAEGTILRARTEEH